jgi:hypothetical protein
MHQLGLGRGVLTVPILYLQDVSVTFLILKFLYHNFSHVQLSSFLYFLPGLFLELFVSYLIFFGVTRDDLI